MKVIPFSNGTEFMVWHANNCEQCANYESESEDRTKAKCKLAWDIDFSTITGVVPLKTAKKIGYANGSLYNTCLWKNIQLTPVEINRENINQLNLF